MNRLTRVVLRGLKLFVFTALLMYLVVNAAGIWLQNIAMFPIPRVLRDSHPGEITLQTSDGQSIRAFWMENPRAEKTILFSHGNGEDLDRIEPFLRELHGYGFNVMAYDYRGYGRSSGRPSEAGLEKDISAAYDWLTGEKQIAPGQIILLGRSLGSGPSVWLASRKPVGGLILESAFTSAYEVMLPRLPYYRNPFPNEKRLRDLPVPVLLIHGTRDLLIRPHHALKNFAAAKNPRGLLWIEGAGHNDVLVTNPDEYQKGIKQFARDTGPLADPEK